MKLMARGGLVLLTAGIVALGGLYSTSAAQSSPETTESATQTDAPTTLETTAAPTTAPPTTKAPRPRTTEDDQPGTTAVDTTSAPQETTTVATVPETVPETTPETVPETTPDTSAAPSIDTTAVPEITTTATPPVEETAATTPETTTPETTTSAPDGLAAAQEISPPVVIDTRCWVNDGLFVWRLTNPNAFDVPGTFLVDGTSIATPTVPAGGVVYVGFAAARQPGYSATFVPTDQTVIPSAAKTSSGSRCAYHLDINLSWRGAAIPSDAELVDFRLIVRSQVEELVFGWAGGGLFLISETALTGDQIFQARAGWLDVPTGGRWESDTTGLPAGWAQRDNKSGQVFAPTLGEVPGWAGPFFGGDDTQQLVLVVRFEAPTESVTPPPSAPTTPAPAPTPTEPAPVAAAVDPGHLPVTGPGRVAAMSAAALALVLGGLMMWRGRRREDEILISRPL